MNKREVKHKEHIDYKWIKNKINGHGGGYFYDKTDRIIIIDWIYGKNFIQIFYYNVRLFIKYLIRKGLKILKSNFKNGAITYL